MQISRIPFDTLKPMEIVLFYKGIELEAGVTEIAQPDGQVYLETTAPMPVGTLLNFGADLQSCRSGRVLRVQERPEEGKSPGMWMELLGEDTASSSPRTEGPGTASSVSETDKSPQDDAGTEPIKTESVKESPSDDKPKKKRRRRKKRNSKA